MQMILFVYIGPTQVKCQLLSSSFFDAMNFQHFLEKLEIMFQHFRKCWKFITSKMHLKVDIWLELDLYLDLKENPCVFEMKYMAKKFMKGSTVDDSYFINVCYCTIYVPT